MFVSMAPAYGVQNLAQALLGQALLAQAAAANARMQMANAQARMQTQMMPQAAFGALSPFAAPPPVAGPAGAQTAPAPQPAAIGLGALLRKAFPQPIISCWGGVSKDQFDLINARRTGAPLLPFGTMPPLPQAPPPAAMPPVTFASLLAGLQRPFVSEPGGLVPRLFPLQPFSAAPPPLPAGIPGTLARPRFNPLIPGGLGPLGRPFGLSDVFLPLPAGSLLPFALFPDLLSLARPLGALMGQRPSGPKPQMLGSGLTPIWAG